MPSQMTRFRPLQQQWRQLGKLVRLALNGFWRGYEPDLAHQVTEFNSCDEFQGLVCKGEYLTGDDGYGPLDLPRLPLGHDPDHAGWASGGATWGLAIAPATVGGAFAQPVVGIWRFPRMDSSSQTVDTIAMTANSGTVTPGAPNPPYDEQCHLFRIGTSAATWTPLAIAFFNSLEAAGVGVPPIATRDFLPDAAVCSFGLGPVQYTTAAAVVHKIYGIVESIFIIANGSDQVVYYPHKTGGATYTTFAQYYQQLNALGTAVNNDGGLGGVYIAPSFDTFVARSVASAFGRVVYLNTIEGGSRKYQRARWSIVGNPFCVWENVLIDSSTHTGAGTPKAVLLSGVGAGYVDFDEFGGAGLFVEPIGDTGFACYFEDGVGFLVRGTTLTGAFKRRYITHDRGALSTHSVVNLGGGVHFGVFTDGWYMLDEYGNWKEAGHVGAVSELEDLLRKGARSEVAYKWKHTFYRDLDPLYRKRTYVHFNPVSKLIYIQWWSRAGRRLWIYDIQNDRISTDDYGNESAWVFGNSDSIIGTLTTWTGSAGTTWEGEAGQGSWADLATFYNNEAFAHGTEGGYVYLHLPELTTRNGQPLTWSMRTKVNTLGDVGRHALWHRIWVQYMRLEHECDSAQVEVEGTGGTGSVVSAVGSVNMMKGTDRSTQSDDMGCRVPGDHHSVRLSGVGVPKIQSITVEFSVDSPDGIVAVESEA